MRTCLLTHWVWGLVLGLGAAWAVAAPELVLRGDRAGAVYRPGETLTWQAIVRGAEPGTIKEAHYTLKHGGGTLFRQGPMALDGGSATIQAVLNQPCAVLVEATAKTASGRDIKGLAGAVVAPEKIPPSAPCPNDFDAFWKTKLAELAAVPANPVLAKTDSGKAGVDYWKITMDNIRGTKIRGQLARPSQEGKFPATLIVQYAGVYPLGKGNVTGPAGDGWLALLAEPGGGQGRAKGPGNLPLL